MRFAFLGLAGLTLLAGCQDPCADGRICATVGTGELGWNGDGLPGDETRLASPTSVAVDLDGRPVIVDYSNMLIRRVEDDGTVTSIVGNGRHAYSEIGADALETPLENPVDARWGPDGLLYVLPQHEGRLIRIESSGAVGRVCGTGQLGDTGDGGPALEAELGYTGGFAFGDGDLYIADNTNSRVRRVRGEEIQTVLGTGEGGLGEPGYGPETAIRNPERIVWDDGRLLVADASNHRVLALDPETLQVTLVAGTGESGYTGDGGPASEATLNRPTGVLPIAGGVLVADFENTALRFVDADGSIETVAGGFDLNEDLLDSEEPLLMPIRRPAGLALTPDGDLLIAERSGHRLLRWNGAEATLQQ